MLNVVILDRIGIIDIVSGHGLEFLNISGLNMLYEYEVAAIGNGFWTRLKTLNLRMCRTKRVYHCYCKWMPATSRVEFGIMSWS